MAGYHLVNVLRQDAGTLAFVPAGSNIPVDIQSSQDASPPITTESYLLGDNPVTHHTIFAYATPQPVIHRGDNLIEPALIDHVTGQPASYIVLNVRPWSWHLEIAAIKPVRGPDIRAINAQILSAYAQTVQWLQRITDRTPGVQTGPGFEPFRQQQVVTTDGTFGVGLATAEQLGYLSAVTVQVGIVDQVKDEQWGPDGLTLYEGPQVYFQNVTLTKGDVLVLNDGRRFVVGDSVSPMQVYGYTILEKAKLEARDTKDQIYQIPVSQSAATLTMPLPWFGN